MIDSEFSTTLNVRVYYEDTDASGVVYHANYLKYFERGRTEWLAVQGFTHHELAESANLGFTLARIMVDYKRPARLDDRLSVSTALAECGRARIDFTQRVVRGDEVLVMASARVACIDLATFRPRELPPEFMQGA